MQARWLLPTALAAFTVDVFAADLPSRAIAISDPAAAFALGMAVDICGTIKLELSENQARHPHESCLAEMVAQHKLPDGMVLPTDPKPFLPIVRELDKAVAGGEDL